MTRALIVLTVAATVGSVLGVCAPSSAATTLPSSATLPSPTVMPVAGVMFDQIDRTLAGAATPPPPGSFAIELELIKKHQAVAKNSQASQASRGTSIADSLESMALSQIPIPFVGNWISSFTSRAQEKKAQQAAAEMRNIMNAGTLMRLAFYNGWTRVEVPGEYAIITRPDLGKKYTLDLQNKVYSTSAFGGAVAGSKATFAPGSAQLQSTTAWTLKEPLDIDGLATAHYEGAALLLVSEARGVCEDGEIRESVTEYVTELPEPALLAGGLESLALPQGCTPAIERHSSGDDPNARFFLYRLVRVENGGSAIDGPLIAVSQRANIKTLGAGEASLFAPPPDFAAAR
jgi:hypothetical protein